MKFFVTLLFSMLMKFSLAEVYLEQSVPGAVQRLNSVKPGDTVVPVSGIYKDETVKFTSNGTKENSTLLMKGVVYQHKNYQSIYQPVSAEMVGPKWLNIKKER